MLIFPQRGKMLKPYKNPSTLIYLSQGKFCIVDTDQLPALSKFTWHAEHSNSNWYAKTTVYKPDEKIRISMHRFIARTRKPLVTHHKNHNTLDNRRSNLQNMTKRQHSDYHCTNNLRIYYGYISSSHPRAHSMGNLYNLDVRKP